MNGRVKSRNGSALLIVLGMLSFMVISAVAFSMFMRENRLPSSFLRQKLVANHLVKAALANAMNEIDAAIGSNPYPGVTANGGSCRESGYSNTWQNRVFTGKETKYSAYVGGDNDATVPTLTLEALAYLPPPLINTVRYMSRHTPTALWSQLKYDAGRYAYTAVNVSDYLDINRLRANVMRDGSSSNRVSLAYLFDDSSKAKKFDDFIKKVREDGDYKSRLVSLADYNLAIGSSSTGGAKYGDAGFKSPFLEYFSGGGDGTFYTAVPSDAAKHQQFVTDSWYPAVATNGVIYLSDDDGQPFDGGETFYALTKWEKDKPIGNGSAIVTRLSTLMDGATLGALCDYVDDDSVPISLAIPTIERTPMLTGIFVDTKGVQLNLKYADSDIEVPDPNSQNGKKIRNRRTWMLDEIGHLSCDAHGVYPFYRTSGLAAGTYKAQMLVKAFFSENTFDFEKTRLDEFLASKLNLRPVKAKKPDWKTFYPDKDKWNKTPYITELVDGTVTISGQKVEIDFSDGITFDSSELTGLGIYGVNYDKDDPSDCEYDSSGLIGSDKDKEEGVKGLLYYYTSGGGIKAVTDGDVQLKLNFAVYVRILDKNNNTVDLVPARLEDDIDYNGNKSADEGSTFAGELCGESEPVLPVSVDAILDVNLGVFQTSVQNNKAGPEAPKGLKNGKMAIFCDDPRFNFAPEDWYTPSGDFGWENWQSAAVARCDGKEGRQSDIFQFVSDCGYLQSMGELQFLPYLERFQKCDLEVKDRDRGSATQGTDYYESGKYNGGPLSERDAPEKTANHKFAWRTHWAFGEYADWARPPKDITRNPYNWGILDSRDGVVVNPYSSSDELLMAGLVNTPYDWTVAGLAADGDFTAGDVDKFTFNSKSSEATLADEKIKEIASSLRDCLLDDLGWDKDLSVDADWRDDWNGMWDTPEEILGVPVDNIHDVDRKFLYSYWKGCFGNRQQLFLIFVRAEPTSMGAGIASHTPAQLGARAVALVWREPISSIESSGDDKPHRMRILFYHQFE